MIHKMNLNDNSFIGIKSGLKTIEIRLNEEKISAEVIKLHLFNNFEELYKQFDKISLGYKENEFASPNDMNIYYSKEEQEKYGVVGIE